MGRKRKLPRGVAASLVVYSRETDAFLLIKRKWNPDKGKYAFPGGMMEVDREDLYETARREVEEETGLRLDPSNFILLDVLSHPKRDPKGHVVDVAFMTTLASEQEPEKETHEVFSKWFHVNEAEKLPFALGHRQLFDAAKAELQKNKRSYLSAV